MYKQVKSQYGGGIRRFSCEEDTIYENIESELCFFTSQERQTIIKYWLDNLRAKQGDVLHNIHFLEGQPISTYYLQAVYCKLCSCYSIFRLLKHFPQNLSHCLKTYTKAELDMTLGANPHIFGQSESKPAIKTKQPFL